MLLKYVKPKRYGVKLFPFAVLAAGALSVDALLATVLSSPACWGRGVESCLLNITPVYSSGLGKYNIILRHGGS